MSRSIVLASAVALGLSVFAAHGAENHSAHQSGAEDPAAHQQPTPGDHSGHQMQAPEDHSAHQQSAPEDHAAYQHHESMPMELPSQSQQAGPTRSERRHVPPDPPQLQMHDMSTREMIELMQMDDDASFGQVRLDRLEWTEVDDHDALSWDAQAWYGGDYDKLWLKTEGASVAGDQEGRAELLWDHTFARWWSLQAGMRHDFGEGPSRTWAAFGVQGLAPYWFEVDAALYVGEEGRTAARFSAEYELLLTQRLILQPQFEFNVYAKDDPRNALGSGLADTQLGLRLRYEIRREFAPYAGVVWSRLYGDTADLARSAGHDADDVQLVIGLRAWF